MERCGGAQPIDGVAKVSGTYDRAVFNAKDAATAVVRVMARHEVSGPGNERPISAELVASTIDALNKAWDELTDCLVRQRKQRDEVIRGLIDELAEANKR